MLVTPENAALESRVRSRNGLLRAVACRSERRAAEHRARCAVDFWRPRRRPAQLASRRCRVECRAVLFPSLHWKSPGTSRRAGRHRTAGTLRMAAATSSTAALRQVAGPFSGSGLEVEIHRTDESEAHRGRHSSKHHRAVCQPTGRRCAVDGNGRRTSRGPLDHDFTVRSIRDVQCPGRVPAVGRSRSPALRASTSRAVDA